jgi:poly-beta-1,6-N-acetyl-D-glucosamine synthase
MSGIIDKVMTPRYEELVEPRVLIVSPVRNEAAHIERVVRAIAAQQLQPARWIVVEDASTDGTLELLRSLSREVPFMEVLEAGASSPHAGARDRHYLRLLLERFAADPRLGLAGGVLVEPMPDGEARRLVIPRHHVHGALKCYSRECFEAIGGVQERLAWDTIDETYARMRGFATLSFEDVVSVHHRRWGSADGVVRGRLRLGECAYITHYPPSWVALRSVKLACSPPHGLSGLAYLFGYIRAAARRSVRVEDSAYRQFTRRELRRRMMRRVIAARA